MKKKTDVFLDSHTTPNKSEVQRRVSRAFRCKYTHRRSLSGCYKYNREANKNYHRRVTHRYKQRQNIQIKMEGESVIFIPIKRNALM